MVQRMIGPAGLSAGALSREVGVSQPTLSLWLRTAGSVALVKDDEQTKPPQKRPDDWTPQQKLAAVMEAAGIAESELGTWLRHKGLTTEHLRQWQDTLSDRATAIFGARERRPANAEDRKRLKELERELERKDKALAEAAALLVLQGKMKALWEAEDGSTRQSSEERSSATSRKRKRKGRR